MEYRREKKGLNTKQQKSEKIAWILGKKRRWEKEARKNKIIKELASALS
jgi:hypothetical protein